MVRLHRVEKAAVVAGLSTQTGMEVAIVEDRDFYMRAVERGSVFGLVINGISALKAGASSPEPLVSNCQDIKAISAFMGELYWTGIVEGAKAPALMKRPLSGGIEMLVEPNVRATYIAVDSDSIYYSNPYLRRLSRKDGASEQIGGSAWQIQLSSGFIYWSEDHGILRLPKAP